MVIYKLYHVYYIYNFINGSMYSVNRTVVSIGKFRILKYRQYCKV